MKESKTIVIGVCGGIAGYKILDLIRLIKDNKYNLEVILTQAAVSMFPISDFEKVLGKKVNINLFDAVFDYKSILQKRQVQHIKLADSADIFIIAPATANILGKLANGIADDLLTTTLLAITAPILICPSMNVHMWQSDIVQENIRKLKKRGFYFLDPEAGDLACGYVGIGRLAQIRKIYYEIVHILKTRNSLVGKKILVTAGGTSESIDAVRVITNRSSGKMGSAIADECAKRGAEVRLIKAKNSVNSNSNLTEEFFETASELENLLKKYVPAHHILFHTAAVSDFRSSNKTDYKIDSNNAISLRLSPTPKILHQIKKWNPKIKLIGFKAVYRLTETNIVKIGMKKLAASDAEYIVVNDVGRKGIGFAVDDNEVYIISAKGLELKIDKTSKVEVAKKMIDHLFQK